MENNFKVEKVACMNCEEFITYDEIVSEEWMVLGEKCSVYVCPYCGETDDLLFIYECK